MGDNSVASVPSPLIDLKAARRPERQITHCRRMPIMQGRLHRLTTTSTS